LNYEGPKEVLNEDEKYTPNEQELNKIEEILSTYPKPETVEIKEEQIQYNNEDAQKVIYEPIEEYVDSTEEVQTVEDVEEIEVKPEPVEERKNKVLNYFK